MKPVSRFFAAKSAISKVLVVLVAATSFTFFSQVPLERLAIDAQEELAYEHDLKIHRYRAVLRQEWTEVGRYLAAEYLEELTRELEFADRKGYRDLFTEIDRMAGEHDAPVDPFDFRGVGRSVARPRSENARGIAERVSRRLAARHYATAVANTMPAPRPSDAWIDRKLDPLTKTAEDLKRKANSPGEWARYQAEVRAVDGIVAEQGRAVERARIEANERVLALKKTFAKFVGQGMPAIEGLAGEYVNELASKFSDFVVEEAVRRSPARQTVEASIRASIDAGRLSEVDRAGVIARTFRFGAGAEYRAPGREAAEVMQKEIASEFEREVARIRVERDVARRQLDYFRKAERARWRARVRPRGR